MAEVTVRRVAVQQFHSEGNTVEMVCNAADGTLLISDSTPESSEVFHHRLRNVTREIAQDFIAVVVSFLAYEDGDMVYMEYGKPEA